MRIFLLSLIGIAISTFVFAQNNLIIKITNLKNNEGLVWMELFDKNGKSLRGSFASIENQSCTITFHNLEQGTYAFKYFHDENRNKKLDTNWLGIPIEGFGFSNNARGLFGPPDLKKTLFDLKQNRKITCQPIYYF